ncbi:hypothetical protein CYMTET_49494 [Cymbomonas tetramitiformis]|uniref:Uncharacterized protein n=1 Tax=Cymbomonas tetramitiformis TaxID=36881 RepID=A0AAE0ETU6_9CHLO|nr:hypothetical protein CYMTET_49494 [Cymbomonas tetramitiformis]
MAWRWRGKSYAGWWRARAPLAWRWRLDLYGATNAGRGGAWIRKSRRPSAGALGEVERARGGGFVLFKVHRTTSDCQSTRLCAGAIQGRSGRGASGRKEITKRRAARVRDSKGRARSLADSQLKLEPKIRTKPSLRLAQHNGLRHSEMSVEVELGGTEIAVGLDELQGENKGNKNNTVKYPDTATLLAIRRVQHF